MKYAITVAVVTRNRAKELEDCLASLSRQTLSVSRLLIVNNNSSDNTSKVINKFISMLPIREIIEKKSGYPSVYNRAIKEVDTPWIAFIDDDCVADKFWYSQVNKAIQQYAGYAAILGSSNNYYPNNPYACAMQFSNDWARLRSIKGKEIVDYRILDSRNVVYNRDALRKNAIKFDETFTGGAEDSDLGLQIAQKGLKAIYDQHMVVYHKEPTTHTTFRLKKRAYLISGYHIQKKWASMLEQFKSPHYYLKSSRLFLKNVRQLSFMYIPQCFVIVVADMLCTKIIRE